MTSNMNYGKLKPTIHETHNRWFPKETSFSKANLNRVTRRQGLNTTIVKSRVHDLLDVYY